MTALRRALPRILRTLVPALLLAAALANTSAQASINVELEGVEGPERENVLAYLSLARYAPLDDLSPDVVDRIFNRAEAEVWDALRPFGYYNAKVIGTLTPDGRNWIAHLTVTPGLPVMISAAQVTLAGPGAGESFLTELVEAKPLQPGHRLDHATYESLKGELQRRATANGYLDAHYTQSEMLVDPAKLSATITLTLETGARYRFGDVTIDQDVVNPSVVKRLVRFRQGDWYDAAALLRTQFALDDSAYFRVVQVLPGDRDSATLTVPVRIDARRGHRNRYTIGVGYDTDFGPRLRFAWNNRYVNTAGHRLRFGANLAKNNQQISATYVMPIGDPAREKAQLDLTTSNLQLADARVRSAALRPSLTHVLGRWQRVLFTDLLRTQSTAGGVTSNATIVVPGISLSPVPPSFTGDGTTASTGTGFFAELIGSGAALGSSATFLRVHVRDDWRFKIAPLWSVLARVELGASLVRRFEEFPVQYRFFAGGDRSVRGFSFNSLSPLDVIPATATTPVQRLRTGGKYLEVASLELERDLPHHFAAAVFTDVGNAFNRFGDPLEYSTGIGVRYKLPFVSVGLDVAKPLSRGGSPRLHLNIAPIF